MARRYDSRTTIFSPEGRLYQVEYAMEAISHSGAAVGMLAGKDAAVLAAEKRITSKLLDSTRSSERLYQIDDHVGVAVAGITADANILINSCRLAAQRYTFNYQEPMPLEQLVQQICDQKQVRTRDPARLRPSPPSHVGPVSRRLRGGACSPTTDLTAPGNSNTFAPEQYDRDTRSSAASGPSVFPSSSRDGS